MALRNYLPPNRENVGYTVFPVPGQSIQRDDPNYIHYVPMEPLFGDRLDSSRKNSTGSYQGPIDDDTVILRTHVSVQSYRKSHSGSITPSSPQKPMEPFLVDDAQDKSMEAEPIASDHRPILPTETNLASSESPTVEEGTFSSQNETGDTAGEVDKQNENGQHQIYIEIGHEERDEKEKAPELSTDQPAEENGAGTSPPESTISPPSTISDEGNDDIKEKSVEAADHEVQSVMAQLDAVQLEEHEKVVELDKQQEVEQKMQQMKNEYTAANFLDQVPQTDDAGGKLDESQRLSLAEQLAQKHYEEKESELLAELEEWKRLKEADTN